MKKSRLFIYLLIILAAKCRADTVDAKAVLNDGLASHGLVAKVRTAHRSVQSCTTSYGCRGECKHTYCTNRDVPYQEQYQDSLHVTQITVASVTKIDYGKPIINGIPEKIYIRSFDSPNCSSVTQTNNSSLTLEVENNQSISFSRAVTSSIGITAGVNFSVAGIGGANASVTINKSVTVTEGTQSSEAQSVSYSESVNRQIPSMKEIYGAMKVVQSNLSVPFDAEIIVDGDVDANVNNIAHVSQVLSEAERTFHAIGEIQATASGEEKTTYYEKNLSAADCKGKNNSFYTIFWKGSPTILLVDKSLNEHKTAARPPASTLEISPQLFGAGNLMPSKGNSEQDTPSFLAAGIHQCQSAHNIGHTCQVSGISFNDCDEAAAKLRMDDCCPQTQVCGPDLQTGKIMCELGGSSIGFTMSYCVAQ